MLYEIGLAVALAVSLALLQVIHSIVGVIEFLMMLGYLVLMVCFLTWKKVGWSWGEAFLLCFVLTPALVVLELFFLQSNF